MRATRGLVASWSQPSKTSRLS